MSILKNKSLIIVILIICCLGKAEAQEIILYNPLDISRLDEPIVVESGKIKIPADKFPVVKDPNGSFLPVQIDDMDKDGKWDALAFQYSFKPKEKVKLKLEFTDQDKAPSFPSKVQARLAKRDDTGKYTPLEKELHPRNHVAQSEPLLYQFEGPGWENDKVAFRHYLDSRLGKDIFGKTTDKLVIQDIGLGQNYHRLLSWGMDVLKVGNSLGAGATGFLSQGVPQHFRKIEDMSYELISNGPVRSVFRLNFVGVDINSKKINLTEEIIIWSGKYWYSRNLIPFNSTGCDTLITGIVNMHNDQPAFRGDLGKQIFFLAGHAKQSENKDFLGMAIIAPAKQFAGFGKAANSGKPEEVVQTDYIKMNSCNNQTLTTYFLAAWELTDSRFKNADFFLNLVKEEAKKISEPIQISIK